MIATSIPSSPTPWAAIEAGEGTPVVLLHGLGMGSFAWSPIIERLGATRRVIAFDLPGFGATPALPTEITPTPAAIARALVEELRRRGFEPPYDLVGNSLGGFVALEVAKAGLARSVVGLSPAGLWRGVAPGAIGASLLRVRRFCQRAPRLARLTMRTRPGRTLGLLGMVAWKGWRVPQAQAVQAAASFAGGEGFEPVMLAAADGFTGGREIDVPITIAFGRHDLLLRRRFAQVRDELPAHTRWLTLAGCGHVPMWDDPETVAGLILSAVGARAEVATRDAGAVAAGERPAYWSAKA
jgi:pimeloyl-ACP methyl ester carboxylesterase